MAGKGSTNICFLCIFILVSLLDLAWSSIVYVDIRSDDITSQGLPQSLNVTFIADTNTTIDLHLVRVEHITGTLPVYTIDNDRNGLKINKVHASDNKKVAFYQDTKHEAVFELTKGDVSLDRNASYTIIRGEYVQEGVRYSIEPSIVSKLDVTKDDSSQEQSYDIHSIPNSRAAVSDYVFVPPGIVTPSPIHISNSKKVAPERLKRTASPTYFIDITAFVEFNNYKIFLDRSANDETLAVKKVQEYYAFIFTGIDLIYQNFVTSSFSLRVKLTKIVIFKSEAAFKLTYSSSNTSHVETQEVLVNFTAFLKSANGHDLSFPYDHAMLFVGADLWRNGTNLLGLAWVGTLCRTDGYSSSVNEDKGDYSIVPVAAHELGHCLSSKHDGDSNSCSSADSYVMAPSLSPFTEKAKLNIWRFSNCTPDYFVPFITNLAQTASGQTCLSDTLNVSEDIPDVSDRLLGQEIPTDEQCRMKFGALSYDCKIGNDTCMMLYCLNPDGRNLCFRQLPLSGTSCGNDMVCFQGACIYRTVTNTTGNSNTSTTVTSNASTLNITTTSTTMTVSTSASSSATNATSSSLSSSVFTTTASSATSQTSQKPSTSPACLDNTTFTFDGSNCQGSMLKSENLCYNQLVQTSCCASCKRRATNIPGCEYGDRDRLVCTSITSCTGKEYECCQTCGVGKFLNGISLFIFNVFALLLVHTITRI